MFKVGDIVVCSEFGVGEVINIERVSDYPVVVRFDKHHGFLENYTKDGKMYTDYDGYEGEHIRKLTKLEKAMR